MSRNLELQRQLGSVELLLERVDRAADPALRATVQQLVELVMTLHGAGRERILELVHATNDSGDALIASLGRDDLVANLLVLHGLHPLSMEARVAQTQLRLTERVKPDARTYCCGLLSPSTAVGVLEAESSFPCSIRRSR